LQCIISVDPLLYWVSEALLCRFISDKGLPEPDIFRLFMDLECGQNACDCLSEAGILHPRDNYAMLKNTCPPRIILCTLNAKFIHASLGLRYLLANMDCHGGEGLSAQTLLQEFTIGRSPKDIVDTLLAALGEQAGVQIIGFGVYIWNLAQTTEVVRLLKQTRPDIKIVLGGPEVSHEWETQPIVALADHLITGWGDVSFPKLCRALIHGPQPLMKVIAGEQPPLDQIVMPYAEYSDADLAHRLLYVEASRGCPFKCEFCLSSLDKTAWAFDLDAFLAAMDGLYQRGARNFKFVYRTFNLKIDASIRVLQFFLDRLTAVSYTHLTLPTIYSV